MLNFNKIVVYDFETDSPNPNICNPVQLAAIVVNPRTLEIIPDSEFRSYMRPPTIDENDYIEKHKDTIEWHTKVNSCKVEDIIKLWKNAPLEKDVFNDFKEYLLRYHTRTSRKNKFSAPIRAGHNIIKFDNIIMQRLAERYHSLDNEGVMDLFNPRDQIDALLLSFLFFENLEDPKRYSMDELRSYLGMSSKGAHSANQDVLDTANLIIRFMRLSRRVAEKTTFKNAFKKK